MHITKAKSSSPCPDSPKSGSFDEVEFWQVLGVSDPVCFFGLFKIATFLKVYTIISSFYSMRWAFQTLDKHYESSFILDHNLFYVFCATFSFVGIFGLFFRKRAALAIYGFYLFFSLILLGLLGGSAIVMVVKEDFCTSIGRTLQWTELDISVCTAKLLYIRAAVATTTIAALIWQVYMIHILRKYNAYLYRTTWTNVPDDHHDIALQYHRL